MKTGRMQFKDWIKRRGFLQQDAAEYLGFDETYVSHLCTGARTPALDNAVKIERLTGIPVAAWMSKREDERPDSAAKTSNLTQA